MPWMLLLNTYHPRSCLPDATGGWSLLLRKCVAQTKQIHTWVATRSFQSPGCNLYMTSGDSIWSVSSSEQVFELVSRSWRIFCAFHIFHVDCIHIAMLRKAVDAPHTTAVPVFAIMWSWGSLLGDSITLLQNSFLHGFGVGGDNSAEFEFARGKQTHNVWTD